MDLIKKSVIKKLLEKRGAKAEKKFGQHFILSKKALAQMVAAAEIEKGDTIIEIGPGLGTLTQELTKTNAKIIAIEKDSMMLNVLKETLADYKNIKIIQADARAIDVGCLSAGKYKIVANLPYNVATFLIRQWLELKKPPETMVLMIQKEVAQRICAKPPRMNLLAVSVQFYADAKIADYAPAEAFWPRPKVDSAIIKIVPKEIDVFPAIANKTAFFKVVRAGFSQPRKQLMGNLTKKLDISKEQLISIFEDLNISKQARAENLSLEQWISLSIFLHPIPQIK